MSPQRPTPRQGGEGQESLGQLAANAFVELFRALGLLTAALGRVLLFASRDTWRWWYLATAVLIATGALTVGPPAQVGGVGAGVLLALMAIRYATVQRGLTAFRKQVAAVTTAGVSLPADAPTQPKIKRWGRPDGPVILVRGVPATFEGNRRGAFQRLFHDRVAAPGVTAWAFDWRLERNEVTISPTTPLPAQVALDPHRAPQGLALFLGIGRDPEGKPTEVMWDPDVADPHALIGGRTKTGKALDVDTAIPTPAGWTTMGELHEGAEVFDEHGHPCKVTHAFEVMRDRPCFEVVFSDGSTLVADADHLWLTETWATRKSASEARARARTSRPTAPWAAAVKALDEAGQPPLAARDLVERGVPAGAVHAVTRTLTPTASRRVVLEQHYGSRLVYKRCSVPVFDRAALLGALRDRAQRRGADQSHKHAQPAIVTTDDIRRTLRAKDGRANHAVRLCAPVQWPEVNLPVDPYVLGVWLGDGRCNSPVVTSADPEIRDEIDAAGYTTRTHRSAGCPVFAIAGLAADLRGLGVLPDKHIPDLYLRAGVEQRWALLEGLMDTDGHASARGACEFYTVRAQLAEQVRELISSLGLIAQVRSKPARLHGRSCGTAYTVAFSSPRPVFRIARKRDRQSTVGRRHHLTIVGVLPVATRPVRCISVDSPSRLYLAGRSFTPTHNSVTLRTLISQALAGGWQVYVADPKGVDYRWARELPGVRHHGGEESPLAVDDAHAEMGRRQEWMEEHAPATETDLLAVDGQPFRPCLVIADEVAELTSLGDKDRTTATKELLGSLARRSRFVGMVCAFATQRPDVSILPGELRANLGTRVLTGDGDQHMRQMVLEGSEQAPLSAHTRGRGRSKVGGGRPQEVQFAFIDPAEIIAASQGNERQPPAAGQAPPRQAAVTPTSTGTFHDGTDRTSGDDDDDEGGERKRFRIVR